MTEISTELDHLVVVAASLEQGSAWCEMTLGMLPQTGGEHVKMGTHNLLLHLGERIYLEIIAVNPAAPAIGRTRWFGMDADATRVRAEQSPFLATFVARTNDIEACHRVLPEIGPPMDMQRGALEWRITVPSDGLPREDGALPTVIQWPLSTQHPAERLADAGCRLERLEVCSSDPQTLREKWQAIGLREEGGLHIAQAGKASLRAVISTPTGLRTLE